MRQLQVQVPSPRDIGQCYETVTGSGSLSAPDQGWARRVRTGSCDVMVRDVHRFSLLRTQVVSRTR